MLPWLIFWAICVFAFISAVHYLFIERERVGNMGRLLSIMKWNWIPCIDRYFLLAMTTTIATGTTTTTTGTGTRCADPSHMRESVSISSCAASSFTRTWIFFGYGLLLHWWHIKSEWESEFDIMWRGGAGAGAAAAAAGKRLHNKQKFKNNQRNGQLTLSTQRDAEQQWLEKTWEKV